MLTLRLRDSGRGTGFDYTSSKRIELVPGENFVIDFRGTEGSFSFGRGQQGVSRTGGNER